MTAFEGVLEDKNDNVVVLRAGDGHDRLFWLSDGITCQAALGEKVRVTCSGDLTREDQVPDVVSVTVIE